VVRRGLRGDPNKQRRYERLARGPYFAPVVDLATAYVAAALTDAADTEGEFWALSCLPGTSPRRLSALTMRITDILVVNKAEPGPDTSVEALVIVERSTFEEGFGRRALARRRYPRLRFTDSEYHGGRMADFMMGRGRVMHWRGHNPMLADHALGRA
jgi:hypothetical protein